MSPVIYDSGIAYQVFTGGSDESSSDRTVIQFRSNRILRFAGGFTPEVGGISKLGFAVVDPQVDGLVGAACDDDAVEPCPLEFGAPVSSALGIPKSIRKRRFAPAPLRPCPETAAPVRGPAAKIRILAGSKAPTWRGSSFKR